MVSENDDRWREPQTRSVMHAKQGQNFDSGKKYMCPEGFEYVKGYRKDDGTYVKAYCRERQEEVEKRVKKSEFLLNFVDMERKEGQRITKEINEKLEPFGGKIQFSYGMNRNDDGTPTYAITQIDVVKPPYKDLVNIENGKPMESSSSMLDAGVSINDATNRREGGTPQVGISWPSFGTIPLPYVQRFIHNVNIVEKRATVINEILEKNKNLFKVD